jgi:hypothetical protein
MGKTWKNMGKTWENGETNMFFSDFSDLSIQNGD